MNGQIILQSGGEETFFFSLVDDDGNRLFTSVAHSAAEHARARIQVFKDRVVDYPNFERKKTPENKMYFVIRTREGDVMGQSEAHASIAALENSITAVHRLAPDAVVVDLSHSNT